MNFHQSPLTKYIITGTANSATDIGCFDFAYTQYGLPIYTANSSYAHPNPYTIDKTSLIPYAGWNMGRNINLFFDTPFWPTSALQITVKIVASSSGPTSPKHPVLIAPNVVIRGSEASPSRYTDYDPYYTFLRGNPVYANGKLYSSNPSSAGLVTGSFFMDDGSGFPVVFDSDKDVGAMSTGEVRVQYSGRLSQIEPVGARASQTNNYWVQPTDTIELIPLEGSKGSNLAGFNRITSYDNASNYYPIITAVKNNNNQKTWSIEFSAMINNSEANGVRDGVDGAFLNWQTLNGAGDWKTYQDFSTNSNALTANELYFCTNVAGIAPSLVYTVKGLAKDALRCRVVGRDIAGNQVFSGILDGAANLTYFRNNNLQYTSNYFDPTKYTFVSLDELKTLTPNRVAASIATVSDPTLIYTVHVGKDASGVQPLKCLAIHDPGSAFNLLAVTVTTL